MKTNGETEAGAGEVHGATGQQDVVKVRGAGIPGEVPPAKPGESARDYAGFLAYYRLSPRVAKQVLAEKMGVSPSRLSHIKRRWRWEERIMAHQDRTDLPEVSAEWKARREDARQREWDVHLETMQAAEDALERWRSSDKVPTFAEIAKMIEISSRLARLATGLPLQHTQVTGQDGGAIRIEFQAALKRAYGDPQPAPAEVVDTVEVREPAATPEAAENPAETPEQS